MTTLCLCFVFWAWLGLEFCEEDTEHHPPYGPPPIMWLRRPSRRLSRHLSCKHARIGPELVDLVHDRLIELSTTITTRVSAFLFLVASRPASARAEGGTYLRMTLPPQHPHFAGRCEGDQTLYFTLRGAPEQLPVSLRRERRSVIGVHLLDRDRLERGGWGRGGGRREELRADGSEGEGVGADL